MNFGLIGANGVGKSTLLSKLIEIDKNIVPFSFSNVPVSETRGIKRNFHGRNELRIVPRRIEDVLGKWGRAYQRSLFSKESKIVMDEIFLTKLLRKAPMNKNDSESFIDDFQEFSNRIREIELSYIDSYIFVKQSEQQWLANILTRPTVATNSNSIENRLNRYRVQNLCLEYYLSKLPKSPHMLVGDLSEIKLTEIKEFIAR